MAHFHFATVTTLSADRTDLQIYIVAKFGLKLIYHAISLFEYDYVVLSECIFKPYY